MNHTQPNSVPAHEVAPRDRFDVAAVAASRTHVLSEATRQALSVLVATTPEMIGRLNQNLAAREAQSPAVDPRLTSTAFYATPTPQRPATPFYADRPSVEPMVSPAPVPVETSPALQPEMATVADLNQYREERTAAIRPAEEQPVEADGVLNVDAIRARISGLHDEGVSNEAA